MVVVVVFVLVVVVVVVVVMVVVVDIVSLTLLLFYNRLFMTLFIFLRKSAIHMVRVQIAIYDSFIELVKNSLSLFAFLS